jgi:hypothetical protein
VKNVRDRGRIEYMMEVAYHIGRLAGARDYHFGLDLDDFFAVCSYVVEDFFNDDYAYIAEFLDDALSIDYVESKIKEVMDRKNSMKDDSFGM